MIQKLKTLILVAATAALFGGPMLVPIAASAACSGDIQSGIAQGVGDAANNGTADSCSDNGTSAGSSLQKIAKTVVNIFSIIVGITAVLFVIYGGFRYITSGGDSGSVGNAKNTLIYALVGLVIVALAQLIVHYVLSNAADINNGSTTPGVLLLAQHLL